MKSHCKESLFFGITEQNRKVLVVKVLSDFGRLNVLSVVSCQQLDSVHIVLSNLVPVVLSGSSRREPDAWFEHSEYRYIRVKFHQPAVRHSNGETIVFEAPYNDTFAAYIFAVCRDVNPGIVTNNLLALLITLRSNKQASPLFTRRGSVSLIENGGWSACLAAKGQVTLGLGSSHYYAQK